MSDTIGTEVRRAREKRRLTQAELAEKIGYDVGHVSRIERDATDPSIAVLRLIAKACKCNLRVFLEAR